MLPALRVAVIFLIFKIAPLFGQADFVPLPAGNNCFPKTEEPQCAFSITGSSVNQIRTECLRNVGSAPALRIAGEFNILRIVCSASYAIDSQYFGIQPTEATFVEWWKEIEPNSGREIMAYVVELKIYSVEALFEFYNNPNNSYFDPSDNTTLLHMWKRSYSRSGLYEFKGIFNQTIGTSFVLFLEDSASPTLLGNDRTMMSLVDNQLKIPCLPTHYDPAQTEILLEGPSGPLSGHSYNPIDGFTIQMNTAETSYYGNYSCTMKFNGAEVDTKKFSFQKNMSEHVYGLEDWNWRAPSTILFAYSVVFNSELQRELIFPICKVNSFMAVDRDTVFMVTIPSINFAKMRSVQQFVLPKFYNQSYTARTVNGTTWDSLTREVKMPVGSRLRMGTRFCSAGNDKFIDDYGSGLKAASVIHFGFRQDWAHFDRRTSEASTHFVLELLTGRDKLYANTTISFSCRVNIPVVVKPIVWYTRRKGGVIIEEFIDNRMAGETSFFSKRLTIDVDAVFCMGSYWYSDYWRNVSVSLPLKEGMRPSVTTSDRDAEYKFKLGSTKQQIRCEATGFPVPKISFRKDHNVISQSVESQSYVIYIIGKVDPATFGTYTCTAENEFSSDSKEFKVELEEESGDDTTLIVTIPIVVFTVTVIGAYVYIKFCRPEKTGLTKEEVREFIEGLKNKEQVLGKDGEYAHDFANMVPYTGEYEISSNRFQIDETRILGSGAYGVVMRGLIDNEEVAIKTIKRNADKQYLKALLSELKIMIYLGDHPNIVTFLGAYTKELAKGNVYVFVKFFALGNLEGFLRKNKTNFAQSPDYTNVRAQASNPDGQVLFDSRDLLQWAVQLADGMAFLGSKKVIHGDLASRNVLLDLDKCVKITDFGLSRQLYDYSDYVKKQQEPLPWRWMALESLKYLSFSTSSDVWAYAITVWEIFSLGEVPYPGYSWNMNFVEELERGLRMACPKYASNLIYQTLCECWHEVPEKRPTFKILQQRFTEILKTSDLE